MLEFLPKHLQKAIENLNNMYLYEIRMRANRPITVNYQGNYHFLGQFGLVREEENAIVCSNEDIADCLYCAGNYSVYSVEEQIKQGFVTAKNGERIGIAGEYVFEKGQVLALRNATSLCIRVPHEILGCGLEIYNRCMRDIVRNLLVMSPPGLGKTTILRDLGRLISEKKQKNLLICDERGEIAFGNIGNTCDIIKYADKATAFEAGIRAMRPDIIITDELSIHDCVALQKAKNAGVKIVASAHFDCMEHVEGAFLSIFDRYVLLKNQVGEIDGIFDEKGRVLSGNA